METVAEPVASITPKVIFANIVADFLTIDSFGLRIHGLFENISSQAVVLQTCEPKPSVFESGPHSHCGVRIRRGRGGSRTKWVKGAILIVWVRVTAVAVVIEITAETAVPSEPMTVADMDTTDMAAAAQDCDTTAIGKAYAVATAKAFGMAATAHAHTMTAAAKAAATAMAAATAVRHRDRR